jgi:transposase
LATTTSGVPLGLHLLDGNASDRATLAQQVAEVVYQFRAEREEEPIYVADSALYSAATMMDLEQKKVWWVSRVPETSTQAKAIIAEVQVNWQGSRALRWSEQEVAIGERTERWIVVQSAEGVERQQATLQRRAEQDRQSWTKRLRELEQRTFACEADAQIALSEAKKGVPAWLEIDLGLNGSARYAGRGRPRTGVPPQQIWTIHGTISVVEDAIRAEAERKAKFIVATNVPASQRSAEDLVRVYKAQSGVERGFAFRNRSTLLSLLGVRQEDRAGDGNGVRDGPLPLGLSAGGAPYPAALSRGRSKCSRSVEETDAAVSHALVISVLRRDQPGPGTAGGTNGSSAGDWAD